MFSLHILQAHHGDCLIIEFGCRSRPNYILIDGGPSAGVYNTFLKPELLKIKKQGGRLDLAVLSHVDNDHVIGLLEYFTELRLMPEDGAGAGTNVDQQLLPGVQTLWHNSFNQTIGQGEDLEAQISSMLAHASAAGQSVQSAVETIEAIGQGHQLRLCALALGIPINAGVPEGTILLDTLPEPIHIGPLTLQIVGPSRKNLERLKEKWIKWLEKNEEQINQGLPLVQADRSIPNLSSIMFLAQVNGKRMLLTGDGLGDDLLEGLIQAGLLEPEGTLHVDLLKLPHHGSARNMTPKFFRALTADRYVISANGLHGNPDQAVLIWLVEAARERGQPVEILITNETSATRQLIQEYSPQEYGYTLTILDPTDRGLLVEL